MTGAVREAEPLVQRSRPVAAAAHHPQRRRRTLVDTDLERLACTGTAYLDRTDQRVAGVELGVASLGTVPRGYVPARVEGGERDRVARLDGEDRLEVTGEVAVQRPPLERDFVQRH